MCRADSLLQGLTPGLWPVQSRSVVEGPAALDSADVQAEPAARRSAPVASQRRGLGVQPPLWLRRAGCRRHGQDGPGVEDGARAISLCSRICAGDTVSKRERPLVETQKTTAFQMHFYVHYFHITVQYKLYCDSCMVCIDNLHKIDLL